MTNPIPLVLLHKDWPQADKTAWKALFAEGDIFDGMLHPGLSDVYREQVTNLTTALRDPSSQAEATSIIRGLLNEIRLVPEKGEYTIELVGELAGLLALGVSQNEQSHPEAACSTLCSTQVVAGVGFEPTTFRL